MPGKNSAELTERTRELLQHALRNGWSPARIASGMQERGQLGWNDHVVTNFANGHRQALNIDEGVVLLAVIGGDARFILKKVESLTEMVVRAAERSWASHTGRE